MSIKFLDKLSQDFTKLLNDNEYYDVKIEVGKDQNKKTFTAHSLVLHYRSSYFRTELKTSKKFLRPDISSEVFDVILK
jgi:BTB/POZ domain